MFANVLAFLVIATAAVVATPFGAVVGTGMGCAGPVVPPITIASGTDILGTGLGGGCVTPIAAPAIAPLSTPIFPSVSVPTSRVVSAPIVNPVISSISTPILPAVGVPPCPALSAPIVTSGIVGGCPSNVVPPIVC